MVGANVVFKCENFQKMGAFKMRGASNAILKLTKEQQQNGVITHSSGNFGQAVALSAKLCNIKASIVMPSNAPAVKKEAVKGYGATIIECKPTLEAREATANAIVKSTGATFLHPYNCHDVIAGNSTATIELLEQKNQLDSIIAPIGGGGLISGTALASNYFSNVKVYGAEPKGADDAFRSFKEGKINGEHQSFLETDYKDVDYVLSKDQLSSHTYILNNTIHNNHDYFVNGDPMPFHLREYRRRNIHPQQVLQNFLHPNKNQNAEILSPLVLFNGSEMKLEDYIYGLIKHPRKYGLEDKELHYFESTSARVIYGEKAKGGLYIIKDIDYIESN